MVTDLQSIFDTFIDKLIAVLPMSPFQPFISRFADLPYLSYLNWFFPVGECLAIGAAWLGAVAIFYLYSIIMRWVKLIGD